MDDSSAYLEQLDRKDRREAAMDRVERDLRKPRKPKPAKPVVVKRIAVPTKDGFRREQLADVIGELISIERKAHRDELAKLQRRIAELEQRHALGFAGVWRDGESYRIGSACNTLADCGCAALPQATSGQAKVHGGSWS